MENSYTGRRSRRELKNVLIEPFKQVRFGLYMLGITLTFLAIATIILVNSFFEQYNHVLSIFNVVEPNLRWEFIADKIFYSNMTRLGICFAIFIAVLFSTVFKLTHRIYGPLIAISRFIDEMQNGNYSARINLRKKDELQDLARRLNELAASLEKKK